MKQLTIFRPLPNIVESFAGPLQISQRICSSNFRALIDFMSVKIEALPVFSVRNFQCQQTKRSFRVPRESFHVLSSKSQKVDIYQNIFYL